MFKKLVDQKKDTEFTYLTTASRLGMLMMVKLLLAEGGITDEEIFQCIRISSFLGHFNVMKYLIGLKPELIPRLQEVDIMHRMAKAGDEAMIIYMLNKGVDINQINEYNCTALYDAVFSKHFNAAFFMLEAGIKANPNNCNLDPIQEAKNQGMFELEHWIKEFDAR